MIGCQAAVNILSKKVSEGVEMGVVQQRRDSNDICDITNEVLINNRKKCRELKGEVQQVCFDGMF